MWYCFSENNECSCRRHWKLIFVVTISSGSLKSYVLSFLRVRFILLCPTQTILLPKQVDRESVAVDFGAKRQRLWSRGFVCPTKKVNPNTNRYETGNILQRWLLQMGAQIIYTPSLSPEFNVAEYVLQRLRCSFVQCKVIKDTIKCT